MLRQVEKVYLKVNGFRSEIFREVYKILVKGSYPVYTEFTYQRIHS